MDNCISKINKLFPNKFKTICNRNARKCETQELKRQGYLKKKMLLLYQPEKKAAILFSLGSRKYFHLLSKINFIL